MVLPASGGAGAMAWHAGAGPAGQHPQSQRQQQQQSQSYLALPPSTTTRALAGFLHLPSIAAGGAPMPGERLLWARIMRPVPGVIPPPPLASVAGGLRGNDDDDGNDDGESGGEDHPRLGGRLWPCLVYFGGCVEVRKELDAGMGTFSKTSTYYLWILCPFCFVLGGAELPESSILVGRPFALYPSTLREHACACSDMYVFHCSVSFDAGAV